ncbi:MAG: glycosyltransferase family 39 protein [Gammaproteobacteria bacterium]
MAFGESEWAFRLPSALCGVLMIVLSFYAGRRFLTPVWNLAFTAAVALLPEFIVDAQTARMYTFLVTCVAGYLILLFRWERTDNAGYLAAAVLTLIVGIQFQTLAIFAAFMAFYPGLVRGELHKVVFGAAAFAAIVAGFMAIDHWIVSAYPSSRDVAGDDGGSGGARAAEALPQIALWMFAVAAVGAGAIATFTVRRVRERIAAIAAAALIALGLLAQVGFSYHLAALLMIAGIVIAARNGELTVARVLPLVVVCSGLFVGHVYLLHANGVTSLRQVFGAMLGWPSIWPQIIVARYSIVAALLTLAGVVAGLWCLAHRKAVPDHVLLAVLGVWIPLLVIGVFMWNVQLRYTSVQTLPLVLCAFATAQWFFTGLQGRLTRWQGCFCGRGLCARGQPDRLRTYRKLGVCDESGSSGRGRVHPVDHPGPNDIVIAEGRARADLLPWARGTTGSRRAASRPRTS